MKLFYHQEHGIFFLLPPRSLPEIFGAILVARNCAIPSLSFTKSLRRDSPGLLHTRKKTLCFYHLYKLLAGVPGRCSGDSHLPSPVPSRHRHRHPWPVTVDPSRHRHPSLWPVTRHRHPWPVTVPSPVPSPCVPILCMQSYLTAEGAAINEDCLPLLLTQYAWYFPSPPSERDPLLDSWAHTDPPMLPVGWMSINPENLVQIVQAVWPSIRDKHTHTHTHTHTSLPILDKIHSIRPCFIFDYVLETLRLQWRRL